MKSLAFRKQVAAFVSRQKQIRAEFDNQRTFTNPYDQDLYRQLRNDNATSLDEFCDVTGFSAKGLYEILAGVEWDTINFDPDANTLMDAIKVNLEYMELVK